MHQSDLFVHGAGCEQSYQTFKKMNRKERASSLLPPLRCRTCPCWRHFGGTLMGLLGKLLEELSGSGHCQPGISNRLYILGIHTKNLSFLFGSSSVNKYTEVG